MVIGFHVPEARSQLLEEGEVYTYRWKRRAFFRDHDGKAEYTWANSGRGTKKIADVKIIEIKQFDGTIEGNLEPYHLKSGFWNTASWCLEITEMGLRATDNGWLYHVILI